MIKATFVAAVAGMLFSGAAFAQYGPLEGLKIDKPEDTQDIKPTPAPDGAVSLFNGKDVTDWTNRDGNGPCNFKVIDGGILEVHGGDSCTRKLLEGDYKLHVEFRIPYEPDHKGQDRGNSGVYLNSHWEVQVLDAYHNDTYADGACAAIYSIEPAKENAAKAPTIWQSYDLEFHAPKCTDGKQTEPGTVTVIWNGVKVHDNTKLTKDVTPAGRGGEPCRPGPLMLQDHGHPVQYRNIWMQPLK